MRIIESDTPGVIPVIEGTAQELTRVAWAAAGAVNRGEAVAFGVDEALIGFRLVEKGGSDV